MLLILEIPDFDEHGTPKSKMPDCPICGADELGMIGGKKIICFYCDFTVLNWKNKGSS